jgi:hypothetical protein
MTVGQLVVEKGSWLTLARARLYCSTLVSELVRALLVSQGAFFESPNRFCWITSKNIAGIHMLDQAAFLYASEDGS